MRSAVAIVLGCMAMAAHAAAGDPALDDRALDIVARQCIRCHGGVREKAGVNLATREGAVRSRPGMPPAVVPGHADASALLARVSERDPARRMPPTGAGLSDQELDVLRRWIDAGASYPEPWAQRPVADRVPRAADPAWDSNPVDRSVNARLQRAGIPLPAAADPRSAVRRAALDLTGLPPDPSLVEAFAGDPSEASWARTVDALLASPAFGERWARPWLDLARYADTKGYEKDARRDVWRFRDWLIDALNADLPYDRFTERVLAGDLLPGAGEDDRIATAFHRLTLTNDEGGTDDEEFRAAAVMDRTATTWLAWLGTSMQCVQCHSHPYDAIAQREYYRAMAFFDQSEDADRADEAPTMPVSWARGRTTVPVMRELPRDRRRTTHVFERGNWRSHGEAVTPGVPASFPALQAVPGAEPDRLALARWITGPARARAARVEANRLWETLFGRGIVETSEDFGASGTPPADAALLDALAARFIELGWSRKALLREIACSRAYRMDARPSPEALRIDPDNRLMSRAPRFRLEAEAVRDQALAVGGLLDRTMHGPPVFPLQPEGIWMVVYSGESWATSEGGDRWRRALYTFWRRSSPHPSLMAFDSVSRETCTVRRVRTNTPLAALATLNDPTYVEAARALALRTILATPGADDRSRARFMLQSALVRLPSDGECDRLARLASDERARLPAGDKSARAVAGDGLAPGALGPPAPADAAADLERAAWTEAATTVLNLDEFLSRT